MTQHTIDRMAVEVDGEGDAVVMVHGLGGTSNTWTPLMPALSRHRVIRLDLPGSGRSDRAHVLDAGPLTIDRLVVSVFLGLFGGQRQPQKWVAFGFGHPQAIKAQTFGGLDMRRDFF